MIFKENFYITTLPKGWMVENALGINSADVHKCMKF